MATRQSRDVSLLLVLTSMILSACDGQGNPEHTAVSDEISGAMHNNIIVENLEPGIEYTWQVRAISEDSASTWSEPQPVQASHAANDYSKAILSFDDVTNQETKSSQKELLQTIASLSWIPIAGSLIYEIIIKDASTELPIALEHIEHKNICDKFSCQTQIKRTNSAQQSMDIESIIQIDQAVLSSSELGVVIRFSIDNATEFSGKIQKYKWIVEGQHNSASSTEILDYNFTSSGQHLVALTVIGAKGSIKRTTRAINVEVPVQAEIAASSTLQNLIPTTNTNSSETVVDSVNSLTVTEIDQNASTEEELSLVSNAIEVEGNDLTDSTIISSHKGTNTPEESVDAEAGETKDPLPPTDLSTDNSHFTTIGVESESIVKPKPESESLSAVSIQQNNGNSGLNELSVDATKNETTINGTDKEESFVDSDIEDIDLASQTIIEQDVEENSSENEAAENEINKSEPVNIDAGLQPELIDPFPGTQLTDTSVTFNWSANGFAVEKWYFRAGLDVGTTEFADARIDDSAITQLRVSGLPNDGVTAVYIEFSYFINGEWNRRNFQYTAGVSAKTPDASIEVVEQNNTDQASSSIEEVVLQAALPDSDIGLTSNVDSAIDNDTGDVDGNIDELSQQNTNDIFEPFEAPSDNDALANWEEILRVQAADAKKWNIEHRDCR